jgi:hypothetical protein
MNIDDPFIIGVWAFFLGVGVGGFVVACVLEHFIMPLLRR